MDNDKWLDRIYKRTDITSKLTHLTKGSGELDCIDILIKILKEKKLKGSTTKSGFIVGDRNAVCFQEVPLYSIAENLHYESNNRNEKVRYNAAGLIFKKQFIYNLGGRPVIYDKTSEAKGYLPEDQWWKIVNLDLSNCNKLIDWTHEREWRVPGDVEFELKDVIIIVPWIEEYLKIIEEFKNDGIDLAVEVAGIINLANVIE